MTRPTDERGMALVAALLMVMVLSAMAAGFLATVRADQASSGIERDQTQAYAAAHAGVEKLTADLGQLFAGNFSPSGAQIAAVADDAQQPVLPGITYTRPDATSGYRITFVDNNGDNNPDVENPNGTQIATGPYQGLVGLITPCTIEVTARTQGNAEVKMRREFQTVAVPVFQFGLFSENDLSFFAGPNFAFGGKVHSNQNLFLKQDGSNTLTLQDRVTAVGEIIRTHLANGVTGSHNGYVRVAKASGCPAAPTSANSSCFTLGANQGSLVGTLGSAQNEPTWTNVSVGTSNGWLRNGRTGARRLDLPIVSDGATPVDLIRRPPVGESINSSVGRQRFYNMATLRILLSDDPDDLTNQPGVVWTAGQSPVRLAGTFSPDAVDGGLTSSQVFAASTGSSQAGFRTVSGTPSVDGYLLVNRQDRDGNWTDVTREILSLGFSGRRLSDGNMDRVNLNNNCNDVHPNAVIRFQRVMDTVTGTSGCTPATPPASSSQYWPNVLYDAREGMLRDDQNNRPSWGGSTFGSSPNQIYSGQQRMYFGGVMHYMELDVDNFRRWLRDDIGASNSSGCINGGGGGDCPMDVTGFVVYFSDRRGNRTLGADGVAAANWTAAGFDYTGTDDVETGEFGFEDIINPSSWNSTPNGVLDGLFQDTEGNDHYAEDVNDNGVDDVYGGVPRLIPGGMVAIAGNYTPAGNVYDLYETPIDRNVARVNRAFFFRRGLKLVNGGRGNLPANGSQGLTVASENPVYVEGNYNACTNATPNNGNSFQPSCTGGVGFGATPGTDHVSAAVISDSVTFLSNAWNDIRSFVNPHNAGTSGTSHQDGNSKYDARDGVTTWYRVAIIAGKGLNFDRPTNNARDHQDFGTDGGAHNFIRYIENWSGALNYRGSLISFYNSRQGVGTYKCCDIVYGAPTRGYNFDTDFLIPSLLPPRTPMFRDVNTLTFRQILRPTQ
ncbi:MAG: hypothetical protein R2712_02780 [Vicinamibacterales bacterium]